MAPKSDEEHHKARLKVRDGLMRLTLWQLREMRDKYVGRPRTYRLAKEFRVLKSLLRDMMPEAREQDAPKEDLPEARQDRVPEARKKQPSQARKQARRGGGGERHRCGRK